MVRVVPGGNHGAREGGGSGYQPEDDSGRYREAAGESRGLVRSSPWNPVFGVSHVFQALFGVGGVAAVQQRLNSALEIRESGVSWVCRV